MKRIYATAIVAALFAYAAAAQDPDAQKKAAAEDMAKAQLNLALANTKMQIIGLEGGVMSNIKGAPYSAEQITENTQTLGDGTRIHNENAVKIYRDGEGRVRRETPEAISIFDPVAGVGYTLNPNTMTGSKIQVLVSVKNGPNSVSYSATASSSDGKTLHTFSGNATASENTPQWTPVSKGTLPEAIRKLGSGAGDGAGAGFFFGASGPNIAFSKMQTAGKAETLPAQTMEGVSVQGERRTQTIEAGEIGNDRPIQVVNEHWYSSDLQLDVMTRHSDPRSGEQITRLVNIIRGEPASTLFQPTGYQISEGKQLPAMLKSVQGTVVVKEQ